MKNKTFAIWLALLSGPLGVHRFYLRGLGDWVAWLHPIPTALGIYGLQRVQTYGLDDTLSWVLIPLLGFNIAQCALWAIVHGLMTPERWNAKFNPAHAPDSTAGRTQWLTIGAIVLSLLFGATTLMASLVFSFQRYFEYQVEEGRKISR